MGNEGAAGSGTVWGTEDRGQRFAGGWRTDYPLGDRNLSIRFGELTRTRVSTSRDAGRFCALTSAQP